MGHVLSSPPQRVSHPFFREQAIRRAVALSGLLLLSGSLYGASTTFASQAPAARPSKAKTNANELTPERAIALANQGRCREAIPGLRRAASGTKDEAAKKEAGVLGVRCAMAMDDRQDAAEFLQLLQKNFPKDPDVLYVVVHAYSDLSTRAAQDLSRFAPRSVPALELNAEALEMQGKWDDAQKEYEEIVQQDPGRKGMHYRIGRVLLSKPNAGAAAAEQAKAQFEKELEIDPGNAAAHYILGEMAKQNSQWDEAAAHFEKAAQLDAGFGDAFLGWGFCLVNERKYEEAVAPLERAAQLQPGNPAAHYNLAVALSRSGKKEEAEKEYAIHKQLIQQGTAKQEQRE